MVHHCKYQPYYLKPFSWGQGHPQVPSTSCHLCNRKDWCCNVHRFKRCIYKKKHYMTLTLGSHKSCPTTSTSLWRMFLQSLKVIHATDRRRCNYKKAHYLNLTLESRSTKMLPSTLHIMRHMYLQSFKLLDPVV